ncbi:MAG: DUF1080 domain-containing protein [Planctomycetia bacterium]|nr:DUF1080 domain-containing protein [Planctomycetia bacterium]
MAVSSEQFGKALTTSQLMTADEVRAAWGAIPAGERPKDGEAFARHFIAQNKLTEFQAREILAGRGARLIMGDYTVLAEIGAGGMGQVYKARHRRMKRIVALKVMSGAAMKDEAAVKRFQREVQAAARLEHPNIVTAYDSGEAGSVKYLVMQFVDGGDLSDLVKKNGPLTVEVAIDYVLQAAKGLAFAHGEGVIHRDIKPANLLLDNKGVVKILDMGLARIEGGDDGLTATEQVMGTVDYMSPEQATNTKTADARADIYSLGCTLWYLLTAKKAYENDTMIGRLMAHRDAPLPSLVKTRDDVPWPLEQAFHKMIAKRPQDRFQSMNEVIAALMPFAKDGSSATGGSHGGAGGSRVGNNAELASFMNAMGSGPTKPGSATSQVKPASASKASSTAQFDATAQFDQAEVETDPKSEMLAPAANAATRARNASTSARPPTKSAKFTGANNKTKLIAAGIAGAVLLLVAGIIVKVRDKDGNVVAELNVPGGASVEVVPTTPAPAATILAAAEVQRNRAAAEWCLSEKATVSCDIALAASAAFGSTQVRNKSELPREPFYVLRIMRDNGNVSSLKVLSGLTRLTSISIKNTRVSDTVLQQLSDLPKLETLCLAGSGLTDDSLKWAADRFKTLSDLDLRNVTGITDSGLKHLSQLPNLNYVWLDGTGVTAAGVAELKKARPNCLVEWTTPTATPSTLATNPPAMPLTDGWQSLFNGRDLTGWTPQGLHGWRVSGGVLVGQTSGTPGWLMSDAEYDDFEFEMDYKLGPDSNSGVFFRAWPEGKISGADFQEVQLLDDNSPRFATIGGTSRTGAIYGSVAPQPEVRPPAGAWHRFRLAVFKDSARISINGTLVVATELAPGKRTRGRLGLQLYPSQLEFRNLRLRELNSDGTPRTASGPSLSQPVASSSPALIADAALSFNGVTSEIVIPKLQRDGESCTLECRVRDFSVKTMPIVRVNGRAPVQLHFANRNPHGAERTADDKVGRDLFGPPVSADRWTHLAYVVDAGESRLFVDGKLVKKQTGSSTPSNAAKFDGTWIGSERLGGFPSRYDGKIDEIRVSSTARYVVDFEPDERFAPDANTLALYHCDEGSGTELLDSSGHGRHGQIIGTTWVRSGTTPAAAEAPASSAGVVRLFNGVDLTDWTGRPGVWRWEAGELVGTLQQQGITFLYGTKTYRDFECEYEVKLQGDRANSGLQFRSTIFDPTTLMMTGPQAEIGATGKTGYGGLWWQSGPRNGVLSAAPPETPAKLHKENDYNRMTVRCVGKHLTITVNGSTTTDGDFDLPDQGLLGWQLVSQGTPVEVRFRNIVFRNLSGKGSVTTVAKPAAAATIDLLAAIEIPRDVVAGGWTKQGSVLVTPNNGGGNGQARLYLPTPGAVPAEYEVELVIERKMPGGTGMVLGFVSGGRQATAMMDSYNASGRWGIELLDGEGLNNDRNPTKNLGSRLPLDQRKTVRVEVRSGGVKVFCDAEKVVDWQGRPDQLSTKFWDLPNKQSLFLGSHTPFHIHSIRLTPLATKRSK